MTANGDELRVCAAELLARLPGRAQAGDALTEQDWTQTRRAAAALFERFQRLGSRGDPLDLEQSHKLASIGYLHAGPSGREQFVPLLVSVVLVRSRYDSDPRRRAAVAGMARRLCQNYLAIGDEVSRRRVTEVARLWEQCAIIAGAGAEADEARSMAATAARAS